METVNKFYIALNITEQGENFHSITTKGNNYELPDNVRLVDENTFYPSIKEAAKKVYELDKPSFEPNSEFIFKVGEVSSLRNPLNPPPFFAPYVNIVLVR